MSQLTRCTKACWSCLVHNEESDLRISFKPTVYMHFCTIVPWSVTYSYQSYTPSIINQLSQLMQRAIHHRFSWYQNYSLRINSQKITIFPYTRRRHQLVTETAIKASLVFRKLFDKSWGLKSQIILWSFTKIIRSIITYAALVWWSKTTHKTAQQQLQQIEILA